MDEGSPFALTDFWQRSALGLLLSDQDALFFSTPDFNLPLLDVNSEKCSLLQAQTLDIPELNQQNGIDQVPLDLLGDPRLVEEDEPAVAQGKFGGLQHDIWSLDHDELEDLSPVRLQTWEAFEKKDITGSTFTGCLSEAGPQAFDAALTMGRRNDSTGVLPRDVSLRAFCSLALGRSSIFFRWDEGQQSFVQTLQETPTAGLSGTLSHSLACEVMDYASMYRKLQAYSASSTSRRLVPPAVIALRRSMASVLEAIEASLADELPRIRTLLQLQAVIARPRQLVRLLESLRDVVKEDRTDEAAISSLSDTINAMVATGNCFAGVLKEVLAQACRPWLRALASELGLICQSYQDLQQSDGSSHDDNDLDSPIITGSPEIPHNVSLFTAEDITLLSETRATVRLLRTYMPHALSDAGQLLEMPHTLLDVDGATHLHHDEHDRPQSSAACIRFGHNVQARERVDLERDTWASHDAQQHRLQALDDQMSSEPGAVRATDIDPVYAAAAKALTARNEGAQLHWGISDEHSCQTPFDTLRPAIEAQAYQTNRVLLRYLFQDRRLREHLNVHHAYHLLGSGEFVTRLSTALFSAETQSAERKRGVVPTGETMGLRLGVREGQRWPPASSELRLTLAGVLSEAYRMNSAQLDHSRSTKANLPGGLSFAIRELPDAEIDRVMDAVSIYALDFLRLQYAAPPPLDSILTPASMQRYDNIFRLLLRVARAVDLAARTSSNATGRHSRTTPSARRFAFEVHHVTSALMSYFMDVGVLAPWATFQTSLDEIEKALDSDLAVPMGINTLREMHYHFLETIRGRLFLRRKQHAVRGAIEDVLSAVLKAAAALQSEDQGPESLQSNHRDFSAATTRLITLLQALVYRPPKAHDLTDPAGDEGSVVRFLLVKLDWNGFYESRPSS